jgi:transcriptional antiterminator RfaH
MKPKTLPDRSIVCWYLLQSKVRQERNAESNLDRLGVETLCPRFCKVKTVRGKRQEVEEVLFPGYVFVKADLVTEYRKIAYAKGVLRFVSFGSRQAIVGEEVIDAIRTRMNDGMVKLASLSSIETFQSGQTVHVGMGPLSGFEAVFVQEFSGTQRVALLLKAVAYQGRVILDRSSVEA